MTGPVTHRPSEPLLVLAFHGELDLSSAPSLDVLLHQAPSPLADRLVVDLGAVTFMDCAALRPLVSARRRLGPRLEIRNLSPAVERLFRITGVFDYLVAAEPDPG